MKTTKNGYRVTKNGSVLNSIEPDSYKVGEYKGYAIKEDGTYYFFNRKQGETYVYLP